MSTGGGSATGANGVFIPPGQPGVAAGLGQQIGPMAGQGLQALNTLGGNTPAGYAWPFVQGTTQNVLDNPYSGLAVQGGQTAADIYGNQILPSAFRSAPQLQQLGEFETGQVYGLPGMTYSNPAYGQAANVGNWLSGSVYGPNVAPAIEAGFNANSALVPGAQSIMQTGFDPQQALYNKLYQQQLDQANATNAMSGVASTPYGAGLTDEALQNFNINWQNQQLGRQAAALGAAGTAYGQGISDIGAGASTGTGLGGAAQSSLLTPANNLTAATLEGTNAIGSGIGSAGQGLGGALSFLTQAGQLAPSLLGSPYNAFQGVQGNNFGALQNQIALGNQAYVQPQQTISDLLQYLGLGQNASGLANTIGATNFGQLAQGVGGAGQLLGGAGSLFGGGGPFAGSFGNSLFGAGPVLAGEGAGGGVGGLASGVAGSGGGFFPDVAASAAPLAFLGS